MAESFCKSLVDMYEPDQVKVRNAMEEAETIANGNDRGKNDKAGADSDGDSDYDNVNEEDKVLVCYHLGYHKQSAEFGGGQKGERQKTDGQ